MALDYKVSTKRQRRNRRQSRYAPVRNKMVTIKNKQLSPRIILARVFILSVLPILIVASFPDRFNFVIDAASYVVFHNIAEFFSVMVSLSIFGVGWYTYDQTGDRHALFLSAAFLAIGLMDFMHTLSNAAMPAFITPNSPNKSTQYWIAVRLFQASAFLASAYIYSGKRGRRMSKAALMAAALFLPCLLFAWITFSPSRVPDTFIQGVGLTPFKKYSEYLVVGLLGLASAAYWRRMSRTGDRLLLYYLSAFIISIFGEISLAAYTKVYDTYNVLGHIYKVAAFFLIYKGIFIASVKDPYMKLAQGEHARHLASFPQLNPNPVLEIASTGEITFFNPATERTLLDLGIDKNDPGVFLPGDIDSILRDLEKKKGSTLYREVAVKDRVFGQTISLTPRFNAVRIYAFDLTERNRAEEALRASEERFRMLFERAGDAIFLLQAEGPDAGRILAANQAAADMHGCMVQDLMSMKITDLDSPDAAREAPALIKRILGGEWIKKEITHLRKDGRVFPVEISAGLLEYGGQKYILALDRDITERKQAEEAINELNKELAYNVHELNAANKELEAFIYSVSHDLRAPLRSITGFSDFLLQQYSDKVGDKGKKYLDWVIAGATKMNQIIDDLLHLSRISRHEVSRQDVDLSKVARSIIAELRQSQPDRRVSIDIKESITACADARLIEVALSNLLRNAWKFTSKTENARIEFGTFKREGKTVYYVKDNGAGFDQNFAQRLFLPFQRLHSEQEFEGSGIGLAIVERVIRRHGGKIWAEGKTNEGASFFFTLSEERECRP